jgi:hypothetical protein
LSIEEVDDLYPLSFRVCLGESSCLAVPKNDNIVPIHMGGSLLPAIKKMTNMITKRRNSILAIPMAAPAISVNPKRPAMSAMIRKVMAQFNIFPYLHFAGMLLLILENST